MRIELSCGSEIDDRNTQYGENLSPGIEFFEVHADASLPVGVHRKEEPEAIKGLNQENNDFHIVGYQGPKYSPGNEKYRFTAYALSKTLDLASESTVENLRQGMFGKVVGKATSEAGYTN